MSASSSLVQKGPGKPRRSMPLSCAECRRLKLKCSRVFPCNSCVKKGCAAICPNDSLTTGKGNRFVLANTEVLHDKINVLASRVRELEDALFSAHSQISQEPHPLLRDELLQLKRPLERESKEDASKDLEQDTADAIEAVGSLSITESGDTKFFGTTANAWYLLQNEEGEDDDTESPHIALPSDIPWLSHTFPFSPSLSNTLLTVRRSIVGLLPSPSRTRQLADIYYKHAAWMYTPLPQEEFYGSIMPVIYEPSVSSEQNPIDSHRLAVLYLVLAMGTLLDLENPSLSSEASRYYQLGRASLSLDSILECQSIPAIQALILMSHYMFLSFIEGPRWALMGIAVKMAQSVGLHRDSGKWNLNPEETLKRRALFLELYTYDSWQSLTFGRPPSFASAFIDCQMAHGTTTSESGEVEMSFAAWKHRFSTHCLNVVHEQAFGAKTPNYRVITELDKKVRNFYVPPSLRVPGFEGTRMDIELQAPPLELTMQRYIAFAIREITLFYMHRGFFARALEDHPGDPMGSKYAPSVLAAYNSACSFVGLVKSLYSQQPGLTERMWFLFTHVFSCAIVLGSIPTKCPSMALAPSAISHLDSAYLLFEAVQSNARAAKVLPVLLKLKTRAMAAITEVRHPNGLITRQSPEVKEEDEELAALGGKTRLVSRKSPSAPTSPQGSHSSPGTEHSHPSVSPLEVQSHVSHIPESGSNNGYYHRQRPHQSPILHSPPQSQVHAQPQLNNSYSPSNQNHQVYISNGQASSSHTQPQLSHIQSQSVYNQQHASHSQLSPAHTQSFSQPPMHPSQYTGMADPTLYYDPPLDMYDYNYATNAGQWQPEVNYEQMQPMSIDMSQAASYQYNALGTFIPAQSLSPTDSQLQLTDPDSSWRSLFAQMGSST